ncbi:MAG TPA: hypothetical protein VGQ59_06095 [Cyclobacteriaceae bacterium]|nr:hypothetical protein [Cyclobacteriaceae bacterium]
MSKYTFQEGSYDSRFKVVFERFLFNETRHRLSQSKDNRITFSLLNEQAEQVVAQIHFCVANLIASSPCRAPFGSVEFSSSLPPEALSSFLKETEQKLKSHGVNKIVIKDPAHQYRPEQSALLNTMFLNLGFITTSAEINSAIEVNETTFEDKISHAEVKRLKRCRQEELEFRVLSMEMLDKVYFFINECREERGMALSMTLPQLKSTIQNCQNDFFLFGIFQKNQLMAASISVRVNERILYDFYHAHPKSFDQLSPVVSLVDGMYGYCQRNKFELLDLGTSAIDGKVNFSLLNFKTQLGCKSSMKLTFEKDIS